MKLIRKDLDRPTTVHDGVDNGNGWLIEGIFWTYDQFAECWRAATPEEDSAFRRFQADWIAGTEKRNAALDRLLQIGEEVDAAA